MNTALEVEVDYAEEVVPLKREIRLSCRDGSSGKNWSLEERGVQPWKTC